MQGGKINLDLCPGCPKDGTETRSMKGSASAPNAGKDVEVPLESVRKNQLEVLHLRARVHVLTL